MMRWKGWMLAGLLLGGGSRAARADMIGVNFTGGEAFGILSDVTSAGVVPQVNWNNVSGKTATNGNLVDSSGMLTRVTATWAGTSEGFFNPGVASGGGDEILNNGTLISSTGVSTTVTVNSIPYSSYNIYVYTLGSVGKSQQTTLGATSFFGTSPNSNDFKHVDGRLGTLYVYTQSTGLTSGTATPNGDYVLFTGLSGPTQTFSDLSSNGGSDISGFQIVSAPVPEPSTCAMMALGLACLGLATRRKKLRDAAA